MLECKVTAGRQASPTLDGTPPSTRRVCSPPTGRRDDLDEVVTCDYFNPMQAVNIKQLKAMLSSYIRQVRGGETFLVTDRNHVVARLGPVEQSGGKAEPEMAARLAAIGARPPMRGRRPTDYSRPGRPLDMTTARIDTLLDWARGEPTAQGDE